jgi:hypothetical protein
MSKTVLFILFLVVSIVVFDFYIIESMGSAESISAYIIRWSHAYPSIPFLLGFVCGHLFWCMDDKRVGR